MGVDISSLVEFREAGEWEVLGDNVRVYCWFSFEL